MASQEDAAMIQYLRDAGIPYGHLTTIDHSKFTASGNISRHRQPGTGGEGLAVDFGNPGGGANDTPELKRIHAAFYKVKSQLHELIYANGQGVYAGKDHNYSRSILKDHHNHVHVSVNKGTFLHWAGAPAPPSQSEATKMIGKPAVSVHLTKSGGGYWIFAADGGVFAFGDAPFLGSLGNVKLSKPIVAAVVMPDGAGYAMAGEDGGLFEFGSAAANGFEGSIANVKLQAPVTSLAVTPSGKGYVMVAADGGAFCIGDAPFHGSAVGAIR